MLTCFAGENTAYLRTLSSPEVNKGKLGIDISSANSTDEFTYIVHYTSGGTAKTNSITTAEKATQLQGVALTYAGSEKPDVGTTVQVEVKNEGTGEVFYSNAVTFSANNKQ